MNSTADNPRLHDDYVNDVARTWQQVRDELERRHGIKISNARVQQIAREAERKIWRGLTA